VILPDVNVLVYAYRTDAADHDAYRGWLTELVNHDAPFAVSGLVLGGFLRIVTHPKVFRTPSRIGDALAFTAALRGAPGAVTVTPGSRHWGIFEELCRDAGVKGNLVPDAYLAALAIESGCELCSTDRDFTRFPGLRWRHPLK